MKPSPLRLNWVTYPSASYDISEDYEDSGDEKLVAGDIVAAVKYSPEGDHFAHIQIKSRDGEQGPYKFSITAVAAFTFDLEVARKEYRPASSRALVPMIAVNVCRILYAGAREYLAMITSRATYGTAVLDSVLLEPGDVTIESDLEPPEVIKILFGATEEEADAFRQKLESMRQAGTLEPSPEAEEKQPR